MTMVNSGLEWSRVEAAHSILYHLSFSVLLQSVLNKSLVRTEDTQILKIAPNAAVLQSGVEHFVINITVAHQVKPSTPCSKSILSVCLLSDCHSFVCSFVHLFVCSFDLVIQSVFHAQNSQSQLL